MPEKKPLFLRMANDLYDQLKQAAKEEGVTMNAYAVMALREHLRLRKRREARRKDTADD